MGLIKAANLGLRFLLELCMLAALLYWGIRAGDSVIAKIGLGLGAALLAVVVWGAFVAPRAAVRLRLPTRLLVELLIFGLAAAGLSSAGRPQLAWALGLAYLINAGLLLLWHQ